MAVVDLAAAVVAEEGLVGGVVVAGVDLEDGVVDSVDEEVDLVGEGVDAEVLVEAEAVDSLAVNKCIFFSFQCFFYPLTGVSSEPVKLVSKVK